MILEIEGVGKVEVEDSFKALSPEDQDRTVRDIVEQAKQGRRSSDEAPVQGANGAPERGGGSQLAAGLVDIFGGPGDLMASGLRGVGLGGALDAIGVSEQPGTATVTRGLEAVGVSPSSEAPDPDDLGGRAARATGQAVGALLPFGGAARGMQAMGAAAPRVADAGRRLLAPFINTPVRAMAAETAAGAGFGAGEAIAEKQDASPLGQFAAGLAGSVLAAAGPGAAIRSGQAVANRFPKSSTAVGAIVSPATTAAAWTIRAVRAAIFPFTKAGGEVRASRRVRGLSADPEAAARALDEPTIGNLTPAQQTGSDRLMALERAILDKDASLDAAAKQRTANSSAALREALKEPARGVGAEQTQELLGQRLNYLVTLLDQRVLQAQEAATARVAKLEPQRRASEASVIAREELEAALKAAREQESQLWEAIPRDAMVPTVQARQAFQRILEGLPRAQAEDMAEKATRFLRDRTGNQAFKDAEPFKEVHGLYSALRDEARQARAAKEFNRARIADEVADAILDDIGSLADETTEVGRLFGEARTFSRTLNERFSQGSVGRILGRERQGGVSVPPEVTLDQTIGRGGTRGAVSADELRNAIGDSPDAEAAMRDYLRRRFTDYSVRNGQIDANRAQTFVRQNDEMLDRFPDLKQEMQAGTEAQASATRTAETAGQTAKDLRDPKRTATAAFLNADPEKAIETVIRSRSSRTAARSLRRQVQNDKQALAGLKGSFFDYLTAKSRTGAVDEAGEQFLSGRSMHKMLNEPRIRAVATEILTTDEFKRLQRITQELRKLETAQGRLPAVGEPMQDLPNTILDYVGRVFAARAGAKAGAGSSGASLLTASFASRRMRRLLDSFTNDQAEAILRDAVQDKELFQKLLMGVDTPRKARQVERRLIEWMEGYTGTQIGSEPED